MTTGSTLARRAFELFDQLVELPDAERNARLQALHATDPELHALVERLLAADVEVEDAHPVAVDRVAGWEAAVVQALPDAGASMVGQALGPWRIVSMIGRGGMGAVYLAEREGGDFRQRAALKLIGIGLDSPRARERFFRERRILARLDHPNIATLLDGGMTESGIPYFAMSHVEGERIDHWCDTHALPIRERVRLLMQGLDALAFAHRQLVVHRDLKPSNILVDASGHVFLLDFGIAKMLEDQEGAELTRTTDRAFTPEYASPEQLHGEPVSTATDLYQFGVLLYALLAHAHPFGLTGDTSLRLQLARMREDPKSLWESAKDATIEDAGARGSTPEALVRQLRGDLSAIAGHCLANDPRRRYGSVEALREDLQAWLDGRPVSVREPTLAYRANRFLHRHALAVGAAAVVAFALVAGLGVSLWQAGIASREARHASQQQHIAEQQRALVEMQANNSLAAQEVLTRTFLHALQKDGGRTTSARDMVDSIRTMGASDPSLDGSVRALLYLRLARLSADSGNQSDARDLIGQAQPLVAAAGQDRPRLLAQQLDTQIALGLADRDATTISRLSPPLIKLLDTLPQPLDNEMAQVRASGLRTWSWSLDQLGHGEEAIKVKRIQLADALARYGPDHQRTLAAQSNLARVQTMQGHYAASIPLLRTALQGMKKQVRPSSMDQTIALIHLAEALQQTAGGTPAAQQALQEAQALAQKGRVPPCYLVWIQTLRADILRESGDLDGARASLQHMETCMPTPGDSVGVGARVLALTVQSDLAWESGDPAASARHAQAGISQLEEAGQLVDASDRRKYLGLKLRALRAQAKTFSKADARFAADGIIREWDALPTMLRAPYLTMAAETLRIAGIPDPGLAQRAVAAAAAEPEPNARRQRQAHEELRLAQQ